MQRLIDKFEDIVQGKSPIVLAEPVNILTKCKNSKKLNAMKHSTYCTVVGKLLYLTKHSMPDIANAVRDVARHCHDPTDIHWNCMCKCIQDVRAAPAWGLVL